VSEPAAAAAGKQWALREARVGLPQAGSRRMWKGRHEEERSMVFACIDLVVCVV
jgi:hypothetical protein